MSKSRARNTVRNSAIGLLSYMLTSITTFISRAIFIRVLGVEYLGVSGLYTNLLAVLALSDLGVNTVMVYSLYKPIAEGDTQRIASLIKYYEKLYRLVAVVILTLGLACIPFLPMIINNSKLPQNELSLYYVLVLMNSVCSYLAITKSTLIRADQNMGIIQAVHAGTSLGMHIVQIVFLLYFKSYTVYLCVPIFFTIANNLILTKIANRKYPYLKDGNVNDAGIEVKKGLVTNLKATFLYKLGATIMNSTDNILISVLLGTIIVGYYNNYYTVVALVNAIVAIFINAVTASIGNYNATQSETQKYELFRILLLVFFGLASFITACYLAVFNDFIRLWIGNEFLLDDNFLLALIFNQALICISNPLWMTREASGVFTSVRYVMISAAALNVLLSVLLGKVCGLAGIILATAIARLLTLFWYEPRMLCKNVFHVSTAKYWQNELRLAIAFVPAACVGWLLHGINTTNILIMAVKIIGCFAVTATSFTLLFRRSDEMKHVLALLGKYKMLQRVTAILSK